ncbi:probable aspartic proteinase GIP2 [Lolium rigidum]|uniref:probable aspartic proteinase GIP2 n=1 Tax=Lolium rigidum TaxID=89674 RepID=UPI001F5DE7B7|nr:probable aspartic proteinase GIP2 [Lolium rigidum]
MAGSSHLVASTAIALLLLLLSTCSCRAASSSGKNPSAVVLPVRKDSATLQYVTGFRQRTPQTPVTVVLDLGGATLWVDSVIPRVAAVAPFRLCYDGSKVGSTRVGPAVPTVELVLQNEATSWVVFGANSMVPARGGALCLGVVDGGPAPRTSVVVGGHMMEDNLLEFDLQRSRLGFSSSLLSRQTTCNNFRLG